MGEQWILDISSELESVNPATEAETWGKRSIYKVPSALTRLNEYAYMPEVASFGPYCHGRPELMPMERHKRRALIRFIKRSKCLPEDIVEAFRKDVRLLMYSYDDLDKEWTEDENKFLEMMIVDGCFLLEIMLVKSGTQYDTDPVFSKQSKQYVTLKWVDILKLENQLPLHVLSILTSFSGDKNVYDLVLEFYSLTDNKRLSNMNELSSLHILDIYRRALLLRGEYMPTDSFLNHCAVELHVAGISFRVGESKNIQGISFSKGVLSIPHIEIDDSFEVIFRNLIAFEQLHCMGQAQDVTSYVVFMDWIINTAYDVALLREKGIITVSGGASDDEIANLFNRITKDVDLTLYKHRIKGDRRDVKREMNEYCCTGWHRWGAIFRQSHFKNPWAITLLIVGFIFVVATVLQTVYTMMLYYKHV